MTKEQLEKEHAIYSHWLFKNNQFDRLTTPHNVLFREQYIILLCRCMYSTNEEDYSYLLSTMNTFKDVEDLADKMIAGLIKGGASKDGKALQQTCKNLRIKHTYKAIREYLAEPLTDAPTPSLVSTESAYGSTQKLSFNIKVF